MTTTTMSPYMETTIPAGQTIADYRRARTTNQRPSLWRRILRSR